MHAIGREREYVREISLHLQKDEYTPGERVEGYAIVNCDDDFECESVNLTFTCTEQSRVVVGSGKHRRVFLQKEVHFEQFREFASKSRILEGETRYEFSFDIPADTYSSFEGCFSFIRYDLNGKIEVKWALDPKTERTIVIVASEKEGADQEPRMIQESLDDNGMHLLRLEVDNDTFQRGDEFRFRFMVGSTADIRGVRTELIHREHVSPQGRETDYDNVLDTQYWEEYRLTRESWVDVGILTNESWPRVFTSNLIDCKFILKVTLDVPWRFDKSIEVPLKVKRASVADEYSSDIFEF